jgi:uncharacterized membrane protein
MSFIQRSFKVLSPQRFFLIVASFFGTLFLFLTPPFQVPDEPNHFYRAWQVSEGGFISDKQDQRIGGYLPASLEKITLPFFKIIWATDRKAKDVNISALLDTPLEPEIKKFYDFNNTAIYSPICYLPEAFGIFILRSVKAPPLYALYAGRIMALLTWILFGFYCINALPFYKWLFAFFALLPMSLFINMSISADVVTNVACFFVILISLRYAFDSQAFTSKRFRNMALAFLLLTSVKAIYSPLILLLLLIPKENFKNTKDRLVKVILLFIIALCSSAFWSALLNPLYLSFENYNPEFRGGAALVDGADMPKQIHFMFENGTYIFKVFYDSVLLTFSMFSSGYIGVFGWLDSPLPIWLICICYLMLFSTAFLDGNKNITFSITQKSIIALAFLIVFFLVFLSQHLIWDQVAAPLIQNIQGRYLIPFAPLLFFLFYNRKFSKPILAKSIVIFTTLIALCVSLHILLERYY